MEELGTFSSLTDANGREKAKKNKFFDILIRSVLCSVLPCLNAESHSRSVHAEKEIKPNKTKIQKGYFKKLELLCKLQFFPFGKKQWMGLILI